MRILTDTNIIVSAILFPNSIVARFNKPVVMTPGIFMKSFMK